MNAVGTLTRRAAKARASTAAATLAAGALVGAAIGGGSSSGNATAIALGALAVVLFLVILGKGIVAERGYLGIEIPTILILLSTLVWRIRDTTSLASQPLDAAGLLRLGALGLGGLLGVIAILRGDLRGLLVRLREMTALWIYVAYVGVVTLGVLASSFPTLTLFRAANLVALLLVLIGAYQTAGRDAVRRLGKTLLWFMVFHLSTVWFWVFVSPHVALRHTTSPFPYRIEGHFPSMSTDRIGEYGVILFFWGIASLIGYGDDHVITSRRWCYALSAFGVVSLFFAQYRTGYVAMVVGIGVLLVIRRRWLWIAISIVGGASSLLVPGLVQFLLRGQTVHVASQGSGRDTLWSAALPIWRHSPIIGNGLETASRFDVLQNLGRGFTSTLHSTWVEALVGTGVIGTFLILSCVLLVLWRAFRMAMRRGAMAPMLIVTVLIVRSITGTSFEAFSLECMLFLVMAMAVRTKAAERATQAAPSGLSGRMGLDWTQPEPIHASAQPAHRVLAGKPTSGG